MHLYHARQAYLFGFVAHPWTLVTLGCFAGGAEADINLTCCTLLYKWAGDLQNTCSQCPDVWANTLRGCSALQSLPKALWRWKYSLLPVLLSIGAALLAAFEKTEAWASVVLLDVWAVFALYGCLFSLNVFQPEEHLTVEEHLTAQECELSLIHI